MNTYTDIWESVLYELRKEFSEIKVNSWFADMQIADIESEYVILMTPTCATLDFVRSETRVIEKVFLKAYGEFKIVYIFSQDKDAKNLKQIKEDIEFTLENPDGTDIYERISSMGKVKQDGERGEADINMMNGDEEVNYFSTEQATPPQAEVVEADCPINFKTKATINDMYTFDNFIVGSSNRFVYNACYAVATNPSSAWNPLFVYGPSGLGKTHLLYAITNELLKSDPDLNIIYVKSEEFTNQLVESLRIKGGPVAFRNKYRSVDVLLVDDIQFIAGKESVQEEFFHTFNELYENQKQIILTSDKPPRDIATLQDRLQNRFEMGLIADIQRPDYELRAAIIKSKAENYNIDIPDDVVTFLAESLSRNIRQIEGALKRLAAKSALYGIAITHDLAKRTLSDMMSTDISPQVITEKIFKIVCKHMQVEENEVRSKSRKKETATARHIIIYLIKKYTPYSLKQIGMIFGKDHTTIMNSVAVVENRIKTEPLFEREITEIEHEISFK